MKFKGNTNVRTVLVTALIVGTMVISGSAWANTPVQTETNSGKYIVVTEATTTVEADGLHVEGSLKSRHFTPRQPIAGVVKVTVHNADGKVMQEKNLHSSSLFVPKGIRQVEFSGVLAGSMPSGGYVTVTAVN